MKIIGIIRKVREATIVTRKEQSIAPSTLGDATRFPYGPFHFKARLPKRSSYAIEASTDLKSWQAIARGVSDAETLEYLDSEASKFGYRFYRLLAGEVYSVNVIGYVSVTLAPGFSMIGNPLDGPGNAVGDMFKDWANGTNLSRFDSRSFRLTENAVKSGKWSNASEKFMPGEGALFFNPTSDYKAHSFVGEILAGNFTVPIPAGFSIRCSVIPRPGSLEDLGFPIGDGDVIHLFDRDRQKYVLYPYEGGRWTAGPPIVGVGESFWVAKTKPGNWIHSFSRELTHQRPPGI